MPKTVTRSREFLQKRRNSPKEIARKRKMHYNHGKFSRFPCCGGTGKTDVPFCGKGCSGMREGKYNTEIVPIQGQTLRATPPRQTEENDIAVPGVNGWHLYLSEETLSKHLLALGSIGSGKTNGLLHIVGALSERMGSRDRMILFDAKGDYEAEFYRPGDKILGRKAEEGGMVWNLFCDLMEDPNGPLDEEMLRQIATTLFAEQIERSQNPTFPRGARDLFVGLTIAFVQEKQQQGMASWETLNNRDLKAFFCSSVSTPDSIQEKISQYPNLQWMKMYLLAPKSATTQSYLAPLQEAVNELFIGCFAQKGSFSIRRFIAQGGQDRLFIAYDPEYGCLMDAMYTVLLDLAMRQAIGHRARNGGSIYFCLDELPMIPALTYLDQLLNFGRSLGIKIVAGIQNVSQLREKYGDFRASSILSGFSTMLCFHLFDEESRELVRQRHGKALCRINSLNQNGRDNSEKIEEMDVIRDWDIVGLEKGHCVVSLPTGEPFLFSPTVYPKRDVTAQQACHQEPSARPERESILKVRRVTHQ